MYNLPQRKQLRLKDYDYSQAGYYFITICTQDRLNLFGTITVGVGLCSTRLHPYIELTSIGKIINDQWYELINRYQNISLGQFVIMPNHIHGIIIIDGKREEQSPSPTAICDIICVYKSITTKLSNKNDNSPGRTIWQRGYHDHIIRNENELRKITQYIMDNPAKWQEDQYFI